VSVARNNGSRAERGYGAEHVAERARWKPLVDAGQVDCWRCGLWIDPRPLVNRDGKRRSSWQLGHDDHDRTIYRGPEHVACNEAAGARKANRLRSRRAAMRRAMLARW
jgi:hypothetical protein